MRTTSIDVQIDELVLHGFAPGDRYRIGDAVERECVRQLAEEGMGQELTRDLVIERVDCGAFEVAGSSDATAIGSNVAQSVRRALKR